MADAKPPKTKDAPPLPKKEVAEPPLVKKGRVPPKPPPPPPPKPPPSNENAGGSEKKGVVEEEVENVLSAKQFVQLSKEAWSLSDKHSRLHYLLVKVKREGGNEKTRKRVSEWEALLKDF